MNLKGEWNSLVTYNPGDAVRYTDGVVYWLQKPCKSGVPPVNTTYWSRIGGALQDAADLILDYAGAVESEIPPLANNLTTTASGKALDARQGKALKTLIDDLDTTVGGLSTSVSGLQGFFLNTKTLVLASSTSESTKLFAITVDDDGELSATEYTPPESGGET